MHVSACAGQVALTAIAVTPAPACSQNKLRGSSECMGGAWTAAARPRAGSLRALLRLACCVRSSRSTLIATSACLQRPSSTCTGSRVSCGEPWPRLARASGAPAAPGQCFATGRSCLEAAELSSLRHGFVLQWVTCCGWPSAGKTHLQDENARLWHRMCTYTSCLGAIRLHTCGQPAATAL